MACSSQPGRRRRQGHEIVSLECLERGDCIYIYGYIILTLYCITYNMYILCLVSKDAFSLQGLVRVYDLRSSRPLAERDHMTLGDPMV